MTGQRSFHRETAAATIINYYSPKSTKSATVANPIPSNDVWIAAHAMETGADLVSADRHFEAVDGIAWLRLDNRA